MVLVCQHTRIFTRFFAENSRKTRNRTQKKAADNTAAYRNYVLFSFNLFSSFRIFSLRESISFIDSTAEITRRSLRD